MAFRKRGMALKKKDSYRQMRDGFRKGKKEKGL